MLCKPSGDCAIGEQVLVSSSQRRRLSGGSELCNNNLSKARSAAASGLFIGVAIKLLRFVFTSVSCTLAQVYCKCVFGYRIAVFIGDLCALGSLGGYAWEQAGLTGLKASALSVL